MAIYKLTAQDRKRLTYIYNEVNKDVYGYGVTGLRIEQFQNMVIFIAANQTIKAITTMENEGYPLLSKAADKILYDIFKQYLKDRLAGQFPFEVLSVLRDFDQDVGLAYTLVILKDPD